MQLLMHCDHIKFGLLTHSPSFSAQTSHSSENFGKNSYADDTPNDNETSNGISDFIVC